jgi:hypothetical protein
MNPQDYDYITITDDMSVTTTDQIKIDPLLMSNTWSINSTTIANIGLDTSTITLTDYGYNNFPLDVRGDANFEGDLKIKGKSLTETLDRIEERLAILRPNEELEEKWENLRGLRKAYMELEKEIIEKEKIWEILKR